MTTVVRSGDGCVFSQEVEGSAVELERVGSPAGLALLVSLVKVDREDSRDHLVNLEPVDRQDQLDHRASQASRVLQGSSLDHQVGREGQANRDSLEVLVAQGQRASWEEPGSRERPVARDLQAVWVSVHMQKLQFSKYI